MDDTVVEILITLEGVSDTQPSGLMEELRNALLDAAVTSGQHRRIKAEVKTPEKTDSTAGVKEDFFLKLSVHIAIAGFRGKDVFDTSLDFAIAEALVFIVNKAYYTFKLNCPRGELKVEPTTTSIKEIVEWLSKCLKNLTQNNEPKK